MLILIAVSLCHTVLSDDKISLALTPEDLPISGDCACLSPGWLSLAALTWPIGPHRQALALDHVPA